MISSSLQQLAEALGSKAISSVELTQLYLDRIARHDARLNAYITIDAQATLAQAQLADQRLARGEGGPLTGIPIAQKDIFCAKGWRTTCASRILDNFVSPYDATVIQRFADAGAVLLGKTNMDEFAMGSSNETSYYGPVRNPWDLDCVPGGSSGGSAAAVAARLTPAATGTDTGGSIRQPAALCNLTGIKPTYGVVSRWGMIAFASSLDQAGALAPSAADCARLLNVMAGFDERDSTSIDRPAEDYCREIDSRPNGLPLAGLKIGLPKQFLGEGNDPQVMQLIEAAIADYEQLGAEFVDVSLPNMGLSVAAYYVIAPAEASSNLARFDGVRYGYRAPDYRDL
ncbi:MAG TPA: amidase family protein, partial [Accumulibacter sp.]|nr:amidase family protein [Accumulibacter sp.]